MSNVNPHWDVTDQPAEPKTTPVASSLKGALPLAVPRGSPRPAAIFGVLLAIGVGLFAATNQSWSLMGEVTSSVITISKTGLDPSTLELNVGGTIAVRNSDTQAHTLNILNPIIGRDPLFTITLQPRRAGVIAITDTVPVGTYTITTTDAIPLMGEVIVNPAAPGSSSSSKSSLPTSTASSSLPSVPTVDGTAVFTATTGTSVSSLSSSSAVSSTTSSPTDTADVLTLERNPYAIGNLRPSAPAQPVTYQPQTTYQPTSIQPVGMPGDSAMHSGAPTYVNRNLPNVPKSGAEVWVAIAAAVAGFWLMIRRSLRTE